MDHPIPPPSTTAQASVLWKPRYGIIDVWRGLASLSVAASHLGIPIVFDFAQACVMAFFVVFGYCIVATTQPKSTRWES